MNKHFSLGIICGFFLLGCAGVTYRYYGLQLPDQCYADGVLEGRGDKDWPNLPLSQCKPDAADKGKCVVQLQEVFFQMKNDLKTCQTKLIACQQKLP